MIKAAILSSFLLLAATLPGLAQPSGQATAVDEGIRRQYNTVKLRDKLKQADAALARNDLVNAAKLYDGAWDLITSIGTGVDAEAAHTRAGIAEARMPLAIAAQRRTRSTRRASGSSARTWPSRRT
jgi:hypothetical protein